MNINIVTIVSKHFNLLLSKHLEEYGISDITQTSNYKEGLTILKEIKPDIVIIDLDIEKARIISIIQEILISTPHTKIITIADSYGQELKYRLLKLGIESFITKPFQPAYLWQELDNIKESLNEKSQITTFNTDSKETYYKNLNSSIRNQISINANKKETDDNSYTSNFSLDTSEDNSHEFEFSFDFENEFDKPQLDTHNYDEIKKDGYLGLPTYLDREAIYKESQEKDEVNSQEQRTSLSRLKGVFKK